MAPEPPANSPIPDLGELIGRDSRTRGWLLTFTAAALFLLVPLAVAFQTTYLASEDDIAASEAVDADALGAAVDAALGRDITTDVRVFVAETYPGAVRP